MYKESDFTTSNNTGDKRIAYVFESENVFANFFWEPGSAEVRGMVGDEGVLHMAFPLLTRGADMSRPPSSEKVLKAIVQKLNRGEY